MGRVEAGLTAYLTMSMLTALERTEVQDGQDGFLGAELEEAKKFIGGLMNAEHSTVIQSMSAIDLKKLLVELRIAVRNDVSSSDGRQYKCVLNYQALDEDEKQKLAPSDSHDVSYGVETFITGGFLLILDRSKSNLAISVQPASFTRISKVYAYRYLGCDVGGP